MLPSTQNVRPPANPMYPEADTLARSFPQPLVHWTRWGTVLVFAFAAVFYAVVSWRWRMAVDTPVMHYVVFLLRHGMKPYSEITDNNMPGAYLSEAAAMGVFGGSDVAWRAYELFLMAILAASSAFVSKRWDWVAGFFGAGMFLVLHSAEGPQLAVERELVIGVLLMAGCAALFAAVEGRRPWLTLAFGFLCGAAISIKPTYLPLPLGLLAIASVRTRRDGQTLRHLLAGSLGLLLAFSIDVAFLSMHHAWAGFHFILTKVLPAYSRISREPFSVLLSASMPRAVALLFFGSLPLLWLNLRRGERRSWQWWALVATAAFGLLSYLAQGKGTVYHRYVFLMFLLVLLGIELFTSLRLPGWPRALALALLALSILYIVPEHLRSAKAIIGQSSYELTLEQDLRALGGAPSLDDRVQCFDMVFGCLDALYHLGLVENSGYTGDMLLFPSAASPASQYYQARFWQLAQTDPAAVLVLSNGTMAEPNGYNKLDRWPAFAAYLQAQYTLALERRFPHERYGYHDPKADYAPTDADSYRIYIRKGSPLWARVQALPSANYGVAR